jgi:peptidoglycan/LPS O-acetylase OafA/YrhL
VTILHPLFSTLIKRPDLVVDHAAAYVELFHDEAKAIGVDLLRRAVFWALAIFAGVLFLILAGVALMLGLSQQFHWSLIVVPAVALLVMIIALVRAVKPWTTERFPELKAQMSSDAEAMRMVS